jgi:hypothetical protein
LFPQNPKCMPHQQGEPVKTADMVPVFETHLQSAVSVEACLPRYRENVDLKEKIRGLESWCGLGPACVECALFSDCAV